MHKIFVSILVLCSFLLWHSLFPDDSRCAAKNAPPPQSLTNPNTPAATAGSIVNTEFFNLKIPQGWFMPYPVNKKPDVVSAVFGNQKTDLSVTVNVIKASLPVNQFMNNVLFGMEKSGLKPDKPVKENGLYKVILKGKPRGIAWFGSNGTLCTATIVLSQSPNLIAANELLGALKSPSRSLFPAVIK